MDAEDYIENFLLNLEATAGSACAGKCPRPSQTPALLRYTCSFFFFFGSRSANICVPGSVLVAGGLKSRM